MSTVAVVLPVHNEEWLIGSVLGQVTDFARTRKDWRFIFVDDGSSDATPGSIREHLDRLETDQIELVRLQPNQGKARAIRGTVLQTNEDLVLFTDGDLAYSLDHLDALVEALETADVAIGSRALARGPQTNITFTRRVVGSSFNLIVRMITGLPYHDTQAGLKGFRRQAARVLFRSQIVEDFAFDAELLYLAKVLHLRVAAIPANVSTRHSYKKSRVNMLKDPLRMFISLLRMRIAHRNLRTRPLPNPENERAEEGERATTLASAMIEPCDKQETTQPKRTRSDA